MGRAHLASCKQSEAAWSKSAVSQVATVWDIHLGNPEIQGSGL